MPVSMISETLRGNSVNLAMAATRFGRMTWRWLRWIASAMASATTSGSSA